jgi:phospho-N-acetylmuramoyl-pentapeptide-transferase
MTGLGMVGFVDDYIKVFKQRSLGLRSGAKMIGILIIGVVFALLSLRFPNDYDMTPGTTHLSFLRDFGPSIGPWLFVFWALAMIAGTSNAVNLTDGLDGLAAGAAGTVLGAYILISDRQLRASCALALERNCYTVRDPLDLAVVASAVLGALIGFLWWNAPPAKIFMGDTGSLGLGGVIAGLALSTQTEILLVVLAGLPVIITLSVIIQVGFFKMTKRRVFKMAPLQHHFELSGWAETTIVVRFWLISALCVAIGLTLFYLNNPHSSFPG